MNGCRLFCRSVNPPRGGGGVSPRSFRPVKFENVLDFCRDLFFVPRLGVGPGLKKKPAERFVWLLPRPAVDYHRPCARSRSPSGRLTFDRDIVPRAVFTPLPTANLLIYEFIKLQILFLLRT